MNSLQILSFVGFTLLVAVITIASQLLLGEGRFNAGNAAFKPSRINPVSGMKRILGWQGLIELGKGLLKLALLGAIAWYWAAAHLPGLLVLGRSGLEAQVGQASAAITGRAIVLPIRPRRAGPK